VGLVSVYGEHMICSTFDPEDWNTVLCKRYKAEAWKKKAAYSIEMLVPNYRAKIQCHKPDDHNMYDHQRQMFNYQGIK
jgi:hypothetical protein